MAYLLTALYSNDLLERWNNVTIAVTAVSLLFGLLSLSEAMTKVNDWKVRLLFSATSFAFVVLAAYVSGGIHV